MELLELLEQKIEELLVQLEKLRDENAQLSLASNLIAQMRDENATLAGELEKEKKLRDEVNARIEKLLANIKNHNPSSMEG